MKSGTTKYRLVKDMFRLKHLAKTTKELSQRELYTDKYLSIKQLLAERMGERIWKRSLNSIGYPQ